MSYLEAWFRKETRMLGTWLKSSTCCNILLNKSVLVVQIGSSYQKWVLKHLQALNDFPSALQNTCTCPLSWCPTLSVGSSPTDHDPLGHWGCWCPSVGSADAAGRASLAAGCQAMGRPWEPASVGWLWVPWVSSCYGLRGLAHAPRRQPNAPCAPPCSEVSSRKCCWSPLSQGCDELQSGK